MSALGKPAAHFASVCFNATPAKEVLREKKMYFHNPCALKGQCFER